MLFLSIGSETVLLNPVPFFSINAYSILMASLPKHIGHIAASDRHWADLQKLINLHPRADIDGFGFPLPEEYWLMDGILDNLLELNRVAELPEQSKYKKKPPAPIESSGDPYSDLLADLFLSYGVEGGLKIVSTLGQNRVNQIIFRANAASIPLEEREEIARRERYDRFMDKNRDLVAGLLGVPVSALSKN